MGWDGMGWDGTDMMRDLLEKVSKRTLRSKISKFTTLDRIRDAHRALQVLAVGKVVVRL
jgi:hypothetical protein